MQSIWNLTGTPQAGMWDAYRYNAEDYDAITGLSYLRARYLSNDTASFMTVDLYLGNLAEPLSLNLYMYVQGNPVRWIDPSGHWAAESDEYGRPIRTVMPKPPVVAGSDLGKGYVIPELPTDKMKKRLCKG